jgi:hypothetical protein
MKRNITVTLLLVFVTMCLRAQDIGGFAYGLKGGLSIGFQKWNNVDKSPLYAYQGVLFIESLPAEKKFSVFAQSGYHVRGSAVRYTITNPNGTINTRTASKYEFNNVSLGLGAKQRYEIGSEKYAYYILGIRGEYTLNTNLCTYEFVKENGYFSNEKTCPFDAFDEFTQKWNYGMILGGGFELELAERFGVLVELSINPDISQQYRQPKNVPRLFVDGSINSNNNFLSEQLVRNTSLELSVGIRLLRIVEYID